MYQIEVDSKIIPIKIGLKQLISLSQIPSSDVEGRVQYLYRDLARSLISFTSCTPEIRSQLIKILDELPIPDKLTADDWYKRGLGEIGLPLDTFERLTPRELDLAYEGYIRRMEFQANLTLLAIKRSKTSKMIHLIEEEDYQESDLQSRAEVFKNLGIKEED